VEQDEGMVRLVPDIRGSDPGAAGLLIECRGQTPQALEVPLLCLGANAAPINMLFGNKTRWR
jgi:D-lactate dehydrogenase